MAAGTPEDLKRRWFASQDPSDLVQCLEQHASARKLRHVMCASIRRLWPLVLDPRSRAAVALIEALIEGEVSIEEAHASATPAFEAYTESRANGYDPAMANAAYCISYSTPQPQLHQVAHAVFADCRAAAERNRHLGYDPLVEQAAQAEFLHCAFDHLYQAGPLPVDAWLSWNDGIVRRLAHQLVHDQNFDTMPILADALEEAGCVDPTLLAHCRDDVLHVRSCWVLDLLLDRA
ncbi:MAG: hypothetical protein U0840_14825 [Gemmataceae bacterium]